MKYSILQMPMDVFQNWLLSGIRVIGPENCWDGDMPVDFATSPPVYSVIPSKYANLLKDGKKTLILIDDVEQISMATPQLTQEWQIRMTGLGESWLPFGFLPELSSEEQVLFRPTTDPCDPALVVPEPLSLREPTDVAATALPDQDSVVQVSVPMVDTAEAELPPPDQDSAETGEVVGETKVSTVSVDNTITDKERSREIRDDSINGSPQNRIRKEKKSPKASKEKVMRGRNSDFGDETTTSEPEVQ